MSPAGTAYREARLADIRAGLALMGRSLDHRKAPTPETLRAMTDAEHALLAGADEMNRAFAACGADEATVVDHELAPLDNAWFSIDSRDLNARQQLEAVARQLDALTQPEPARSVS